MTLLLFNEPQGLPSGKKRRVIDFREATKSRHQINTDTKL